MSKAAERVAEVLASGRRLYVADIMRLARVRRRVLYRLLADWQARGWLETGMAGQRYYRLTQKAAPAAPSGDGTAGASDAGTVRSG